MANIYEKPNKKAEDDAPAVFKASSKDYQEKPEGEAFVQSRKVD